MPITVFYSWQNDRDPKTTRYFIKEAIEKAIKAVNQDIDVHDATREEDSSALAIDHDTKDVPGTPDIVNTIYEKIDTCGIFLADLTYVVHSPKGDGLSNPNVLAERGYALRALGSERLIAVMNTAYGEAKDLPFDFRHVRHPNQYRLGVGASAPDRKKQQELLVNQIATAIRTIIKSGLLQHFAPKPDPFRATPATTSDSVFFQPGEPLTTIQGWGKRGVKPVMPEGPKLYLRVLPSSATKPLSSADAYDVVQGNPRVMPLHPARSQGYFNGRNRYGAVDLLLDIKNDSVLSLTQIFRNGEIWGIDRDMLDDEADYRGEKIKYVPSIAMERMFEDAMKRYLAVARKKLKLSLPLTFIAGATDVEGYRMAASQLGEKFSGQVVTPDIRFEGVVTSYEVSNAQILLPFFEHFWDEFGIRRPLNFRIEERAAERTG